MFKTFGEIFSVKLMQSVEGKCLGYGFVQYAVEFDAMKALEFMNGRECFGKKLTIEKYKSKECRKTVEKNLYVKNLPLSIDNKEKLDLIFLPFGTISSSAIYFKEYKEGKSYYAFVCFNETESALNACTDLNGKEIEGASLYVTKALTKEQRLKEFQRKKLELKIEARKITLYIKTANGQSLNEELVREELDSIAKLKQVSILMMPNGKAKSVGFVVLFTPEDLQKVLREYPKGKALVISKLEGREKRAERIKQMRKNNFDYSAPLKIPMGQLFSMNSGSVPGKHIKQKSCLKKIALTKPKVKKECLENERQFFGDKLYDKILKLSNEYCIFKIIEKSRQRLRE